MKIPSSHVLRMACAICLLPAFTHCSKPSNANASGGPNTPEGQTLKTSDTPVVLAKGGVASVPIVLASGSSDALKKTAADLAGFLKKITGADFAIKEDKEAKGIVLGTLKQFPDSDLEKALVVKDNYDGLEAFAIQTDKGAIRLLSNTDEGVSHAVYRFLELLGCRWFFPGATWEVLPQSKDLSFNLNEVTRPDIWTRDIWIGRAKQPWEPGDPNGTAIFEQWKKANLLGASLKVNVSHAWHSIPKVMAKEFEGHPEYFALVDGKRQTVSQASQLCVTNPGLQQVVVQYCNQYFEKNPTADMVSLDPADWPDWCTCEECAKLGYHSNQAFYLANVAAKEVGKTHPGKLVGLLAYSWHSDAPPFQLEPNVYVQLTAGMNASRFTFEELFKLWTEKCSHVGIYEYYSYWQMDKAMMPGTGVSNKFDELDERMQNFVKHKVNSISAQSANGWGVNGLGYYLSTKLMWNVKADVMALRKDFYEKAFGPAAAVMERYYERLNLSNKPLPGEGLLRQCLADLEEATTAAGDRKDVQARLTHLKENLVYNYIGRKVETAADLDEEKKLTLEWFTWSYRTRNNYMNDWITFKSTVGRPAADKFKEPTWFWRNTIKDISQNPWRNNNPVTPEELAGLLQKMKADLGDVPAPQENAASQVFVLTDSGLKADDAEVRQTFKDSASYLLASEKGEALKVHVEKKATVVRVGEGVVGFVAIKEMKMDAPDALYTLTDASGKEVSQGRLPVGKHDLELKVPAAGVYRFTLKDDRDEWDIVFPKEVRSALVFDEAVTCKPTIEQPYYFYVPKGQTNVSLYVGQQGEVTVRDSANEVVHAGKSKGEYVTIPVKAGSDGKVWSLQGAFDSIWLFDIPTVLSTNQKWILVPQETAKKDGLKVSMQ